jgi:hypothetical protein
MGGLTLAWQSREALNSKVASAATPGTALLHLAITQTGDLHQSP